MSINIHTITDIRNFMILELKDIYPEHEVIAITNLIIKTQLGIDRLHMLTDSGTVISDNDTRKIREICKELKTGKPVQYILGKTTFYNCVIEVNRDTLIPRPETEELVDLIVNENKDFKGRVIDLGTGSGCIAIALKKFFIEADVTGIDISENALITASRNALINNADVRFIKEDIIHFNTWTNGLYDIIVSNPPYVRESEKRGMNKNVLDFEPHTALFVSDKEPLLFYRAIVGLSPCLLKMHGKLYFEINEKMGSEIRSIMESGGYTEVAIINDINGKERFVRGRFNG